MGKPVAITVAMPLLRSGKIAWLALESLCRQINLQSCPWELLVAEEQADQPVLGLKGIDPYRKRLKKAGCASIKYFPIKAWIPLTLKWELLASKAAPSSRTFVFHPADCYAPPLLLALSHEATYKGADWFCAPRYHIYNIADGRVLFYNRHEEEHLRPGGMFSTKTTYARQLPKQERPSSVDSWLYGNIRKIALEHTRKESLCRIESDERIHMNGFYVTGMNNITSLGHLFREPYPPWKVLDSLPFKVPKGILKRLRGLRKEAAAWTRRPWKKGKWYKKWKKTRNERKAQREERRGKKE